jgi:nucleoside-diphosphate-sugar epimerase
MNILITGGAGYVGSVLTPYLLNLGHKVTIYDLMIYETKIKKNPNLNIIKGDIRDFEKIKNSLKDQDIVIHLACISNDPSFELNPNLGKSINLDSFVPLVEASLFNGIKRFIYASSSSVYGIKKEKDVHEEIKLEPLTDYSKFKAECEKILLEYNSDYFDPVIVRPATVCGYSPRQRLDVVVNIFANFAYNKRKIQIFGGDQLRPNIHINDMCEVYSLLINSETSKIKGKIFNAGFENKKVIELAKIVKNVMGDDIELIIKETDDQRSYHISSNKIYNELGFKNKFTIADAVKDLKKAFENKILLNSFDDENYFNIKKMQSIKLN